LQNEYVSRHVEKILDKYGRNQYGQHHVMAVFLRGSRLTGLVTNESDYDYLVVLREDMNDLVNHDRKTASVKNKDDDNFEYQTMSFLHVLDLLGKSNPTMLETFAGEPVFVARDAVNWIYDLHENLTDLVYADFEAYRKAAYGIARNQKVQVGKAKKPGKSLVQSLLVLDRLEELAKPNPDYSAVVRYVGREERQSALKALKTTSETDLMYDDAEATEQRVKELVNDVLVDKPERAHRAHGLLSEVKDLYLRDLALAMLYNVEDTFGDN
jgi:predicted nucleotidyltransferase